MLADVIYYWKMTSFMVLDGVTPFLRLKDITNTCKRMQHSLEFFSAMAESWKNLYEDKSLGYALMIQSSLQLTSKQ